MSRNFEELDFAQTRFGELVLRRRRALSLDGEEFYEVKLGGEFLMSSLVNASEIALAELGLAALAPGAKDVVVGGLGLGYTAATALDDPSVRSLLVVEFLPEVLAWHTRGLVPLGERLTSDGRCRLVLDDFFELARGRVGFDREAPGRSFDAILLDIDHSPNGLLHPSHADLYAAEGLSRLAGHLNPGGVFALWSYEPPDNGFSARLGALFATTSAHAIAFANPLLGRDDVNTVYVATTAC